VAFVLMDFPVPLQQFDDFLEACERGSVRVQAQPENRLVHLPATFETR
jgi:formylglycine-generating enzyme required for sulfatase activity